MDAYIVLKPEAKPRQALQMYAAAQGGELNAITVLDVATNPGEANEVISRFTYSATYRHISSDQQPRGEYVVVPEKSDTYLNPFDNEDIHSETLESRTIQKLQKEQLNCINLYSQHSEAALRATLSSYLNRGT